MRAGVGEGGKPVTPTWKETTNTMNFLFQSSLGIFDPSLPCHLRLSRSYITLCFIVKYYPLRFA